MSKIIDKMYKIGVIKIGQFKLKSGDISPFYIDLRLIPSEPELFKLTIDEYVKLIQGLEYKPAAIAGIMSAGIPFATGIALKLDIPLIQIRKEPKTHGTARLIEGILPKPKSKIVLIDDLISTGASKFGPIEALTEMGFVVEDLIVLIDRTNKKNRDVLKKRGVVIHSAHEIQSLLNSLSKLNIPENDVSIIRGAIREWDSN